MQLQAFFKLKARDETSWLQQANGQSAVFSVSNENIRNQFHAIGLSIDDLKIAKTIQPLIKKHAVSIAADYYDAMGKIPEFLEITNNASNRDQWIHVHGKFLTAMFEGRFDDQYMDRLKKITYGHHRMGVKPQWYVASFHILLEKTLVHINPSIPIEEEFHQIAIVIARTLNFHQQVILEALDKMNIDKEKEIFNKIKEELKEKIYETSESLVAVTEETSASVDELIYRSEKLSEQGVQTEEKTRSGQLLAKDGQEQLSSLDEQIQSIYRSTLAMKETVEALNDLSTQIIDVAVIVEGISNQTNLLSLNASIEAARAGEYGKGFAVVANEVRKLSEQTQESVKSIKELTKQITTQKDKVSESLQEVEKLTEIGREQSAMTREFFDRIVQSTDENLETVGYTKREIQNLTEIIREIGEAVKTIVESTEKLNEAAKMA